MSASTRLSAALVLSSLLSLVTGVSPAAAADVTVEGMVRTLAAEPLPGAAGASEEIYQQVLQVAGETYFLEGAQATGNGPVRATGVVAGEEFIASSVVSTGTLAAIPTKGDTPTLVMLASWTQPDAVTPEWASSQLFGDSADWFQEVSYGRMTQSGDVTPWLQIAGPTSGCYADHQTLMTQAKAAAAARGYNPAAYGNHVLYFPSCGGDAAWYSGWAYVGSTGTWLNGYLDRRVITHEIGHNLGLWHSNSNLCSDGGLAGTCTFQEYGDDYDAMGSSNHVAHYSASQKAAIGWLDGRTVDLSAGGRATLAPMSVVTAATPQAAVVSMPSGRRYWLEYRRAEGFDAWLPGGATNGVLIHATGAGSGSSSNAPSLLDVSPDDGVSVATAALKPGQTWTSTDGVWVRAGAITSAGVEVTTGSGAPPARTPGAVTGFALTSNAAARTATISWSPPTADGGSPITGYRVSRNGTDVNGAGPWSTTLPATARSQTFTRLVPGATYTFTVQAVNAVGTGASADSTAALTTVAGEPTNLTVTHDDAAGTATIRWAPPTHDGGAAVTGYRIRRDGINSLGSPSWSPTVSATARSQTFTRLVPGTTYTFSVSAINAAGTGSATRIATVLPLA
jgi:hypothetical protein